MGRERDNREIRRVCGRGCGGRREQWRVGGHYLVQSQAGPVG